MPSLLSNNMKTIYLLNYNNYYNRTIKKEATLAAYREKGTLLDILTDVTLWNPNDGITTVLTTKSNFAGNPDYLVCCDNDNGIVDSRWFVMEAQRLMRGQYKLTLRRDVLADNLSEILSSPCYVKRGWVSSSSPLIYNDEGRTFSQIKSSQTTLRDKTLIPWVVGYLKVKDRIGGAEFPANELVIDIDGEILKFSLTPSTDPESINKYGRMLTTSDLPFAVFGLPYGAIDFYYGDTYSFTSSREASMKIATLLSENFSGGGWMVDLQLLPYCPFQEAIVANSNGDGKYHINLAAIPSFTKFKNASNVDRYAMGYAARSSFSIATLYEASGNPYNISITDIKMQTALERYRLVSPNFNSIFEFDPTKMVRGNNKTVGFGAMCTYLPNQPYLRIYPYFGNLYGANYLDGRGLICNGDFSLPQSNDAWTTYMLNNKNYQTMFNRNIESMDKQHAWNTAASAVGIVTGAVGGASQGAMTGFMAGGPAGAVGGAVAGGAAGLVGGGLDLAQTITTQRDARENAIQQFNWQKGNIQAQSQTITNFSNFNIDSPKFPLVEVYKASDEEKNGFANYINKYAHAVNQIGTLEEYKCTYTSRFMSGDMIQILGIDEDTHYLNTISEEVSKGFYYHGGEITG